MNTTDDSGYARLEDQIKWYNNKSTLAQSNYKISKVFVIIASALIPILALQEAPNFKLYVAVLGAAIVVAEGLAHINQWQNTWLTYRNTCEALIHEKYAFLERIGPYDNDDPVVARKTLVERAEGIMAAEHSKWVSIQEKAAKTDPPGGKS